MIIRTKGKEALRGLTFRVRQALPGVFVSEQPPQGFWDSRDWIVPEGTFMYTNGKAWVKNADGSVSIVPMKQRGEDVRTFSNAKEASRRDD